MLVFKSILKKFGKKGEKTGWTYIELDISLVNELMPNNRKSFRVKGFIDHVEIKSVALIPMGDGSFIMAYNTDMRKKVGKREGAQVEVKLEIDSDEFVFDTDFITCLEDDLMALKYFKSIPPSHQKYYSKWISSAKTDTTKANRIAKAMSALSRSMSYSEMMREGKL